MQSLGEITLKEEQNLVNMYRDVHRVCILEIMAIAFF